MRSGLCGGMGRCVDKHLGRGWETPSSKGGEGIIINV